jgi:hypothetical protein
VPGDGGGRDAPRRPGRNTQQQLTPPPSEISAIGMIPGRGVGVVVDLADARRRRVERVDGQAGPYWPSWRCCRSWTTAEASRRAG